MVLLFYLKQLSEDFTRTPSSGKKLTQFSPIDRLSPYILQVPPKPCYPSTNLEDFTSKTTLI
jgi:hypothetical protein